MEATIKAMSRISDIQLRRQERFHQNRMKGKKAAQKLQVRHFLTWKTVVWSVIG
jgi:hypothetical protein